jgi:copper chaperone CopZ
MLKPLLVALVLVAMVLLPAGCSRRPGPTKGAASPPDGPEAAANVREVTIHVVGMTKLQGITWLGWPNRVHEALSGLPGVTSLDVDLKKDRFRISYDPERVTLERILETIREQRFPAEVVPALPAAIFPTKATRRNLARLPDLLQRAVQQARKDNKPLLLVFHGPGWLPCQRMSTVTYSDDEVKLELGRWVMVQVDVADRSEVAELFEVIGIPVAVAVSADGVELGRVENFVEPAAFRVRLESMYSRRGRWRRKMTGLLRTMISMHDGSRVYDENWVVGD